MTARTRCGWVMFIECGKPQCGRGFLQKGPYKAGEVVVNLFSQYNHKNYIRNSSYTQAHSRHKFGIGENEIGIFRTEISMVRTIWSSGQTH